MQHSPTRISKPLFKVNTMPHTAHLIYCKTDKGREEVTLRQHGLRHRQRSVLILMDGTKSLGSIATAIPLTELTVTVPFLMQNGFIVLTKTTIATHQTLAPSPNIALNDVNLVAIKHAPATLVQPALTQDVTAIATVKELMITTANTYLGLMSAEVLSRIQRCHSAEQTLAAAAHWHMALRESKIGKVVAADLLAEVKAILHAPH
jgi:hypothetical protein